MNVDEANALYLLMGRAKPGYVRACESVRSAAQRQRGNPDDPRLQILLEVVDDALDVHEMARGSLRELMELRYKVRPSNPASYSVRAPQILENSGVGLMWR